TPFDLLKRLTAKGCRRFLFDEPKGSYVEKNSFYDTCRVGIDPSSCLLGHARAAKRDAKHDG
ncbi:MAG: hypothetical protein SOY71_07795, partial [Dialister sp.]|nr:hypothetical protein [Dialister sp.]